MTDWPQHMSTLLCANSAGEISRVNAGRLSDDLLSVFTGRLVIIGLFAVDGEQMRSQLMDALNTVNC